MKPTKKTIPVGLQRTLAAAYREGVRQGKARERARLRGLVKKYGQAGVMRDLTAASSRRLPKR